MRSAQQIGADLRLTREQKLDELWSITGISASGALPARFASRPTGDELLAEGARMRRMFEGLARRASSPRLAETLEVRGQLIEGLLAEIAHRSPGASLGRRTPSGAEYVPLTENGYRDRSGPVPIALPLEGRSDAWFSIDILPGSLWTSRVSSIVVPQVNRPGDPIPSGSDALTAWCAVCLPWRPEPS